MFNEEVLIFTLKNFICFFNISRQFHYKNHYIIFLSLKKVRYINIQKVPEEMFEKQLKIYEQKQQESITGGDQRNGQDKQTDYGQDENDCIFPPIVSRTMRNKLAKQSKKQQKLPKVQDIVIQREIEKSKLSAQALPKIQIKIQFQENVNVHEYENLLEIPVNERTKENNIVQIDRTINKQFIEKQQQDLPKNQKINELEEQKQLVEVTLQKINRFHEQMKSPTILFQDTDHTIVFQNKLYYQNSKLALSQPIKSLNSECRFRIENIKYCVGFGVGLQQVITKHEYNYQSQGTQQLSHGLYIITSQGYSWSHSQKQQDDIMRQGFNQMYTGLTILVQVLGQQIKFTSKLGSFTLTFPNNIRAKYTVCFCAYLHDKEDSISIVN